MRQPTLDRLDARGCAHDRFDLLERRGLGSEFDVVSDPRVWESQSRVSVAFGQDETTVVRSKLTEGITQSRVDCKGSAREPFGGGSVVDRVQRQVLFKAVSLPRVGKKLLVKPGILVGVVVGGQRRLPLSSSWRRLRYEK